MSAASPAREPTAPPSGGDKPDRGTKAPPGLPRAEPCAQCAGRWASEKSRVTAPVACHHQSGAGAAKEDAKCFACSRGSHKCDLLDESLVEAAVAVGRAREAWILAPEDGEDVEAAKEAWRGAVGAYHVLVGETKKKKGKGKEVAATSPAGPARTAATAPLGGEQVWRDILRQSVRQTELLEQLLAHFVKEDDEDPPEEEQDDGPATKRRRTTGGRGGRGGKKKA